jgi:hypothetical protein
MYNTCIHGPTHPDSQDCSQEAITPWQKLKKDSYISAPGRYLDSLASIALNISIVGHQK